VIVLDLCIFLSLNALAFDSELQPEEVREAYSLGQTSNHEELKEFLSKYKYDLPYPADNPVVDVQSVEFQTPYEQIVLRSMRNSYSKFQADEDYQANPGLLIVRVQISLKLNYVGPIPPADGFKVSVSQAEPIAPRKTASTLLCNPSPYGEQAMGSDCTINLIYLREILLSFNARQFAPGVASVKVKTPDGQTIQTKFNLDELK
jgi:hypothetical protein